MLLFARSAAIMMRIRSCSPSSATSSAYSKLVQLPFVCVMKFLFVSCYVAPMGHRKFDNNNYSKPKKCDFSRVSLICFECELCYSFTVVRYFCCGASEQQHKQDLRRIYRRE